MQCTDCCNPSEIFLAKVGIIVFVHLDCSLFALQMGQTWPLFRLFSFFSQDKHSTNLTINVKSVDVFLGTRTQGGMMEGVDESTELRQYPTRLFFYYSAFFKEIVSVSL